MELQTLQPTVPAEFVALSPYEVDQSRAAMRTWAASTVAEMKGQRLELQATLSAAQKNKWPTAAFERQVDLAKRREEFYRRVTETYTPEFRARDLQILRRFEKLDG